MSSTAQNALPWHSATRCTDTTIYFAVPYWDLASNLECLLIGRVASGGDSGPMEEQTEASVTSYQVPSQLPTGLEYEDDMERIAIHQAVIARTIVAAVKGGRLRRLDVQGVQLPFSIRALLPSWVSIDLVEHALYYDRYAGWMGAAKLLRPCLFHASVWLETTPISGTTHNRLLTAADVQGLRSTWQSDEAPRNPAMQWPDKPRIREYLSWLEQDPELAEQVAAVWNSVVARGEADAVRCSCELCEALQLDQRTDTG